MGFYLLPVISALSVFVTRRLLDKTARLPYDIYVGFYTLTAVIGATIMGQASTQDIWLLYALTTGIELGTVGFDGDFKYWLLIYAPYFIPGISILYIKYVGDRLQLRPLRLPNNDVSTVATLLVLTAMTLFCLSQLYGAGLLGKTLISATGGATYMENILNRVDVLTKVSKPYFGIIYTGMPTIAAYALYRYLEGKAKKSWLLISILSSTLAFYFYLSSFVKGHALLLLILLGLVLMERRLISYKKAFVAGALLFLLLTGMNFFLQGSSTLDIIETASHLVFRMPAAFPFYVQLYPDVLPYTGIDVGLQYFGIGPSEQANTNVMNYMYPDTTYVQGAAPAPAHLTAYAEGGISWSIVILLAIGGVIGIAGRIGKHAHTALTRTIFVCLCISIYYFTQSGFWLSFQATYGLIWALFSLMAIVATEYILTAAIAFERSLRHEA